MRRGSAESRTTASKSITASYSPLLRIHSFTACRLASPASVKYSAPSNGVSVPP